MIKADKHSIAGVILAVFCVAVLAGTGILNPIFANGLGNAPRELRLGAELGLIQTDQCKSGKFLRGSISHKDFVEKTAIVMDRVGVQNCDSALLLSTGIATSNSKNGISRRDAVEMMARAAIYMSNNNIFKMPSGKATNFRDYKVPEKYSAAMGYMQTKFVVRGQSNNNLGSNRKLTQREAVYFLYRLYEAISSDMMTSIPNDGLNFIDISYGHPIMPAIRNLTAAGAFDRAILRPSFDGDSYIKPEDLTELVGGIFDRSGKNCDMLRLQSIFSDCEEFATRKQMTLVLEFLLDTFAADKITEAKVDFVDVSETDPEYQALKKLSGSKINPGYDNQIFNGKENITWFEVITLLNKTLKFAGITNEQPDMNAPAEKEDFERLKNILIKKKAIIRNILGPNTKAEK